MNEPLPPAERVGYAVVGIGQLTREELLPAFGTSSFSRLAALVSSDRGELLPLAAGLGLRESDVYAYDDFERLAERGDIGAVYIVLPNSLHKEYTLRAAKMGLHVLCEKPLGASVEDAEAMVRACAEANVWLMTAYRIQFTAHHREARRLLLGGELGRVKLFESVNGQVEDDPDAWRLKRDLAGGGPLPDVGLYCLNTIRFLTGEEPTEVFAYSYTTPNDERFREVEESVMWMMRFPSGVMASCATSYAVAQTRFVRALAEEGSLNLDPAFDYQGLRLQVTRGESVEERRLGEEDQFTAEIDHFSRCILEGKKPYTPGEEGLQDQRIMAAIYESAREGRPVRLERFEGRDVFRGDPPQPQ